jgi:hypothetical protein
MIATVIWLLAFCAFYATGMEMDVDDVSTSVADMPGAQAIEDVWATTETIFEQMAAQPNGGNMIAELRSCFALGILVNTDYSGMGCAEMGITLLKDLIEKSFSSQSVDIAQVTFWRGSDILPCSRQVLRNSMGGGRGCPLHVFGDILLFVPLAIRGYLKEAHADEVKRSSMKIARAMHRGSGKHRIDQIKRDFSRTVVSKLIGIMEDYTFDLSATSHCYRCDTQCRIHGPESIEDSVTKVAIAGTTCTSWSSVGKGNGWLGDSALAFIVWAFALLAALPCIIIHECTPFFDVDILHRLFGNLYFISTFIFSPTLLGLPQTRKRRWTLLMLKTRRRLRIPFNVEGFGSIFQRRVVSNGQLFFCAPKDVIQAYIRKLAGNRGLPLAMANGEPWPLVSVLPPSLRLMLYRYQQHARQAEHPTSSIFNLRQRPEYWAQMGSLMPTLLRHSTLWSGLQERVLIPMEHLCVQGVPVFALGRTDEERFSVELLALAGELSDQQIVSLSGNGGAWRS